MGSIDEIKAITDDLKRRGIPFYVHVDAAFFGGIPNNQIHAPICPGMDDLGADSISVSFHKFFGVPGINSIVIAKEKTAGKAIDYLGQMDTTIAGSRTFPVFSAYQRIREMLQRSPEDYYCANILYAANQMQNIKAKYLVDGDSNIFVIPCPSEDILKKYQLPCFQGSDGKISLAHFIINPFHTKEEIDALIADLAMDQKQNEQVANGLIEFEKSCD
jgi:histidine decarboxylase